MADTQLYQLTIAELADGYRSRKFSPVEVAQALLQRIEQMNDRLGAYITVAAGPALTAAREAEEALAKGGGRGLLHGVPIGLKDLIDTQSMPTTWGTAFRRGQAADEDAPVAKRLMQAGAVIIGKHNMLEFAMGGMDHNPHYGVSRNPWGLERFPGGSSTGTAVAVAAGLCPAGVGTDTGGSVRQPSSYCGITGLKTTNGLVSTRGVFPLAASADTVGPMARSVEDAVFMLQAMAGYEPSDPTSVQRTAVDYLAAIRQTSLGDLRVGVDRAWVEEGADDEIVKLWEQAIAVLQELGASIVEVTIPAPHDLRDMYRDIVNYEAARVHQKQFEIHGHEYGPESRARMETGLAITDRAYREAQVQRRQITAAVERLLTEVNVLALPTQPTVAPLLGSETAWFKGQSISVTPIRGRFNHLASFTKLPGLSVPMGFTSEDLPVGLQIVAPAFEDATSLRVGHSYQRATDWHRRPSPVMAGAISV